MAKHWDDTVGILLLLAFVMGIVLKSILPVWSWLVIVGLGLVYCGYKLFID